MSELGHRHALALEFGNESNQLIARALNE